MSYWKIERAAERIRRQLCPELSPEDALPGLEIFETLDEHFVTVRGRKVFLDYAVRDLPAGVEGETSFDAKRNRLVVTLSPDIYAALERGESRARFCLWHEIAHAFLHAELVIRINAIPHAEAALLRAATNHPPYEDTEWQAESCASALLMPARGLHLVERGGSLMVTRVAVKYRVSVRAADVRVRIYRSRKGTLMSET